MPAPRMRVGVFGRSQAGFRLVEGMESAGHQVVVLSELSDVASCQTLILAVDEAGLPQAVSLIEPYVRPGLIVIHTCLALGVQVLDELETRGAVVIAVARVSAHRWVVTSLDELGETIAELIVGELGASAIVKSDAERGDLAAHVAYAQMLSNLSERAQLDVCKLMDWETVVGRDIDRRLVMDSLRHIEETSLRRVYVEAARRCGELHGDDELEMWALQEDIQ